MYAHTSHGPKKQLLKKKLREFFYEDDIQLRIQVSPPPGFVQTLYTLGTWGKQFTHR